MYGSLIIAIFILLLTTCGALLLSFNPSYTSTVIGSIFVIVGLFISFVAFCIYIFTEEETNNIPVGIIVNLENESRPIRLIIGIPV